MSKKNQNNYFKKVEWISLKKKSKKELYLQPKINKMIGWINLIFLGQLIIKKTINRIRIYITKGKPIIIRIYKFRLIISLKENKFNEDIINSKEIHFNISIRNS